MAVLPIQLDRARRTPLATQIYSAIRDGIENGRLASGARLPSWQDLAAQLGVTPAEIERWRAAAGAVYLPYDDDLRVHEQNAGFTTLPEWNFEASRDK